MVTQELIVKIAEHLTLKGHTGEVEIVAFEGGGDSGFASVHSCLDDLETDENLGDLFSEEFGDAFWGCGTGWYNGNYSEGSLHIDLDKPALEFTASEEGSWSSLSPISYEIDKSGQVIEKSWSTVVMHIPSISGGEIVIPDVQYNPHTGVYEMPVGIVITAPIPGTYLKTQAGTTISL